MDSPPPPIPEYHNPTAPKVVSGLSPEQITQIQNADRRARSIKRTARFASSEGTFTMVIAVCSLACFLFGWINVVLGVLLAIFAWNALRGAKRLKAFDRSALSFLAWNELFLIAFITLYAFYSIYSGLSSGKGNLLTSQLVLPPEDAKLLGFDSDALLRQLTWGFYLGLIALTAISQGLVAYYYKSREKHLDAYLKDTPQWIIDLQKAQLSA